MGAPDPFAARDAELDALRTERNAALAEKNMWLRRMLKMQAERDQVKADLYACDKCLGEWQATYDDLLTQFRRMEVKLGDVQFDLESSCWLLEHLDPYLPRWLQTHRNPENELLYKQLADCRADDAMRKAPDEAPE